MRSWWRCSGTSWWCAATDPMAPRDLIPLRLPSVPEDAARPKAPTEGHSEPLSPFERGPEITEIR